MSALATGGSPGPASSLLKFQGTEAMQRLDELAIEVAGYYAMADHPAACISSAGGNAVGAGARPSRDGALSQQSRGVYLWRVQ